MLYLPHLSCNTVIPFTVMRKALTVAASCMWVHLGPTSMYVQPSLFCPHRILSDALLLCPSPQPKGVAKPRGMMTLGGGGGMTSPGQTLFLAHLWVCCPLDDWKEGLEHTCPGPGDPSAGV